MVASRGSPTQVGQGVINELIVEWIVSTDNRATLLESTGYARLRAIKPAILLDS
jgi:hypothetical protein